MYEIDINAIDSLELLSIGTDSRKYITKMKKLKLQYPDKVIIKRLPETNDGYLLAYFPKEWLCIKPRIKRLLTELQKTAARERLQKFHIRKHDK